MSPPERPVLWQGTFECACGFHGDAAVLGRRGHRYDALDPDASDDEPHIREDTAPEARAVMDLAPCPSCKMRRHAGRELRRQLRWLAVLLAMSAATALVLWRTGEPNAAIAALVAAAIAVGARGVGLALAWVEAPERLRVAPR